MKSRERSIKLIQNHKEWRNYNFKNKEGFYPVFSDFKEYLSEISPGAITLFIYFGLYSNNQTGECRHTIDNISKNLDKSTRTISNWIKELEDFKLIERIQTDYNTPSKTYIIPYTKKFSEEKNL